MNQVLAFMTSAEKEERYQRVWDAAYAAAYVERVSVMITASGKAEGVCYEGGDGRDIRQVCSVVADAAVAALRKAGR
jgi:hypothetical protein